MKFLLSQVIVFHISCPFIEIAPLCRIIFLSSFLVEPGSRKRSRPYGNFLSQRTYIAEQSPHARISTRNLCRPFSFKKTNLLLENTWIFTQWEKYGGFLSSTMIRTTSAFIRTFISVFAAQKSSCLILSLCLPFFHSLLLCFSTSCS